MVHGTEPRLSIQNFQTKDYLCGGESGEAKTTSTLYSWEKRDSLFKVQLCPPAGEGEQERLTEMVLIRANRHPEPLLDARDLQFQGNAFDPTKCHEKSRWWNLIYVDQKTFLLQSHTNPNQYLVEKQDGIKGVEMRTLSEGVPDNAKWVFSVQDHVIGSRNITSAAKKGAVVTGIGLLALGTVVTGGILVAATAPAIIATGAVSSATAGTAMTLGAGILSGVGATQKLNGIRQRMRDDPIDYSKLFVEW